MEIKFEDDLKSYGNESHLPSSKLSLIIKQKSFGIVKTDAQAEALQIAFVIVSLLVGWWFFTSGTSEEIVQPTEELINAMQPTRPL